MGGASGRQRRNLGRLRVRRRRHPEAPRPLGLFEHRDDLGHLAPFRQVERLLRPLGPFGEQHPHHLHLVGGDGRKQRRPPRNAAALTSAPAAISRWNVAGDLPRIAWLSSGMPCAPGVL